MKKRICFITTVPITMKSFVLDTARYLYNQEAYDITLICKNDETFKSELPEYIKFIPVSMERGINLKGLVAVREFVTIFKENQFDYIQYSTPNASLYASIAAKLAKMPVRLYAQWGIRYVGASGMSRRLLKLFEKITCKLSSHIRAVSPMNMQFSIDEGLYKCDKVKVIGNGGTIGVSLDEFDINKKDELRKIVYEQYGIDDETFVFGFIGRVSKDKGVSELIEAFRKIVEKGYKAKLFIVGSYENAGIDEDVMSWASNSNDVFFTGKFPKSKLEMFYAAFDCYVHPTYREGFGMVLQEAGAMGNAIITTDIPGAGEVMERDISCKLVPPRNAQALADMMEYMINNPEETKELGRQAYVRTQKLYERSIMLNNIAADIKEVLGEL